MIFTGNTRQRRSGNLPSPYGLLCFHKKSIFNHVYAKNTSKKSEALSDLLLHSVDIIAKIFSLQFLFLYNMRPEILQDVKASPNLSIYFETEIL